MSIIPYELSVKLVSDDNVVALGEKWDVLQCAVHGKLDSMLSYPKEFPLWKYMEMNGCRWQIKMTPGLFYFSTFHLLQMFISCMRSCCNFLYSIVILMVLLFQYTKMYPYFNLKNSV